MIVVNGAVRDDVPALDRGLAYGDGVFRTFAVRAGVAMHWQRHYAKLAHDCIKLRLPVPERAALEAEVETARGGDSECAMKIIVTRGVGRRGYGYAGNEQSTRIVLSDRAPVYQAQHRQVGVRVRLCRLKLSYQPLLAGVKHLNRLENVLARSEWSDPDTTEGILLDTEHNVIGGTMSNIFMVAGGVLRTPRLDRCGVAGVTRDRVIEAAAKQGLACEAANLTWQHMREAEEIFVVNSLAGIWPVGDLDGQRRVAGPATRALQRTLDQEDDAQVA